MLRAKLVRTLGWSGGRDCCQWYLCCSCDCRPGLSSDFHRQSLSWRFCNLNTWDTTGSVCTTLSGDEEIMVRCSKVRRSRPFTRLNAKTFRGVEPLNRFWLRTRFSRHQEPLRSSGRVEVALGPLVIWPQCRRWVFFKVWPKRSCPKPQWQSSAPFPRYHPLPLTWTFACSKFHTSSNS